MRRGLVVHSHEITYKRPVEYDAEPLEIQIWVSGVRAASFLCHYEAFDHGRLAATGQTMLVPFDFALNRLVVHGDPPIDGRAFWRTRPITPLMSLRDRDRKALDSRRLAAFFVDLLVCAPMSLPAESSIRTSFPSLASHALSV